MKASDWIKVTDRLPEKDEYVLCATKNGKYVINSMYEPKDCYGKVLGSKEWHGNTNIRESITHWMPIISPKEEEMKECYKPKTSDEIQKASEEYIWRTNIDNTSVQDHFIAGTEWMKEESFDGKALLYAVEKTEERTKKEILRKAEKWLMKYFVEDHYGMSPAGFGVFFQMFKQAMEE